MIPSRETLEAQLNDFDPAVRRQALDGLLALVDQGVITFSEPRKALNLHGHTFFSYNGYGYSPTYFAWKARCEGLALAGTVDFDVLDAVEEFLEASQRLGLKACAGIETRIFIPEFATREINSPGEPGISYHMGVGFTSGTVKDTDFLLSMKTSAQQRNLDILSRVNPYLSPVELDYDKDVLPLAPKGNPTERHLCVAYEAKGRELMPDPDTRAAFWAEKLGGDVDTIKGMFGDSPKFQGLIRAKTMKRGGVGYVKPEGKAFPSLKQVNEFVLAEGAIPTFAFLDGTTSGEKDMDELLDLMMAAGTLAVNIIPERNWNIADPEMKKVKVANLHRFVENAQSRDLPIVVGTEMNAPGQRFVDDFEAPELAPLVPAFFEGAHIMYGHTVLKSKGDMGYVSAWAKRRFDSAKARNAFYKEVGERVPARPPSALPAINTEMTPEQVLKTLAG